jgi:hypothetical protein
MPISRSQMNRQLRMGGGIMQVAPRQGALFGGLKKAVSGVLGSAKDLLKSPLGKAALLYGGSKLLPMAFGQLGKAGGISELFSKGLSTLGLDVASGAKPTLGQFGKVFAIGSLGGAALQALTASGADEEELGNIRDVESLKSYLRQGYKQLNPQAEPEQVEAFVETNTTEYRADGGRIGFAEGMPEEGIETLLPKPKPSQMMQEVDSVTQSVDNFAQLIAQSGDPSSFRGHVDLLSEFIQKNDIDPSAAFDYVKRRVDEIKPGLSKFIFTTTEDMPVENKAYGGRIGYDGGTDFQKWLEGKQKFDQGQNAEQLYREYLEDKRRQKVAEQKTMAANGGRIGFFKGAQADARAGRGAMSPGTSMSGGFRGGGDGDGGGNKDTTPKTNIFDKIKNNPIYQTVSPFVNPFSIGMSQIPVKAQQAIGIGSLLNKLGNVIFSPAGAAEFDMEAFQKAGADKGFFGGMNDELEAMQEYYDAAKSLTASGAKFAGANNPQAVRDFITKQSEIPFGGGSYNIDMSLVPKTFLETQQDFTTQKAPISFFNLGGRAGYAFGNPEQNAINAAGIMDLPLNQNPAGATELDLRDSGGFIPPVGVKEKADDIPAMLSNNEFVFTADAVRGMGDGDVNKGAQRMYDMMKKLEGGGRV